MIVIVIMAAVRSMNMRLGARILVIAVPVMRVAVMGVIVGMRAVIVTIMVVSAVVAVDRRGGDIGAPLRVERRLDLADAGAKPARHILDDGIAPDAHALLQ